MRSIKGSLVGPVLAGILALAPTAVFAHGGGGGGHFGGFAGHSFAGHGFAGHSFNHFRHERNFFSGDAYGYNYPYYDYNDENAGEYSYGQSSPAEVTSSQEMIIAVQEALTRLGYYHGRVDGLIGPQTEQAIRWFQSVDNLPVTGQIDDPTLNALRIS